MNDDKTRAEFEKEFPLPDDCEWNGIDAYCWPHTRAPHPHDKHWEGWQAAKERYGQSWLSVYESEPPQGVRALFMERGTEHVICSFPHRRLWEEQGHDLWMPIPATKEQKHEQ